MSPDVLARGDRPAAEELLALALSRPNQALDRARTLLGADPTDEEAGLAHQAIGVVHRDFGDIAAALRELRTALRFMRRVPAPARQIDVQASLGVALLMSGRVRHGLATLDSAVETGISSLDDPGALGRILIRRVWARWSVGAAAAALPDADRAVELLAGAGDLVWEARAYDHRATVRMALGAVAQADQDYARSERLFEQTGQLVEYADTRQERAAAAYARGDVPAALALLDDARRIVDELGILEPELHVTRARVLMAVGLAHDATVELDQAIDRSERQGGSAVRRAELLLGAARAARAAADPEEAERRSAQACSMFRRQHRGSLALQAELVLLAARYERGDRSSELLRRSARLAARLAPVHRVAAAEAELLAGRLALARGRERQAEQHLRSAAGSTARELGGVAVAWVSRAELHELAGRHDQMLRACGRGLQLIDRYLGTLGATELRTGATAHGAELAALALRHAVRRGDARLLLSWSERWRATVLAVPPVRTKADPELVTDLASLRDLARRLDRGEDPEPISRTLAQERRRLEDAVRRRALRAPASGGRGAVRFDPAALRGRLGPATMVGLTEVDGDLHGVVVTRRSIRMTRIGPARVAEQALAHTLFALRRQVAGHGRHRADLADLSARLERGLLGDCVGMLADGPVVVVPTGRLHSVPWAMLPGLRDREVSVAPSATAWCRIQDAEPAPDGDVVLVAGPGLAAGQQEVQQLAGQYRRSVLLAAGTATADRVLAALDGARLAHVAAHGTLRSDSPLFSALELDDGPLTVYDLERLTRAPHRVILSSCSSAVGTPTGADELLGLVSAFIAQGSVGILASVVPVEDPATVPFMTALHRRLQAGDGLPAAHLQARRAVEGDPRVALAAGSFVALGR